MKHLTLCLAMLLTIVGTHPQPLQATEKCRWIWYASDEYYDLDTGAFVIYHYYRWFCDGQLNPW